MSIKLMSAVWDNGPNDMGERLVLLSLADQANDEGYCWPSMKTIARRCALARPSVSRIIKRLAEQGYIQPERRRRKDGSYTSNGYWVNADMLTQVTESDHHVTEGDRVVTLDYRVVTQGYTSESPSESPSESYDNRRADADLINAIGEVCGMSPYLNFGKLQPVAGQLLEAGYTAKQVTTHYARPSGWWYENDWRGQKGQPPTPRQIIETIYGAVNFVPVDVAKPLKTGRIIPQPATTGHVGGY